MIRLTVVFGLSAVAFSFDEPPTELLTSSVGLSEEDALSASSSAFSSAELVGSSSEDLEPSFCSPSCSPSSFSPLSSVSVSSEEEDALSVSSVEASSLSAWESGLASGSALPSVVVLVELSPIGGKAMIS